MNRVLVSILLLLVILLAACSPKNEKSFFDKLELKTLDDKILTVADLQGKPAFINFWATWCKPCLQEMPSIENAKSILEKGGYQFIAVSNEDKDRIQSFVDKSEYTFEFAQFAIGLEALNIYSLPTSYVVDGQGNLVYEHVGAEYWDSDKNLKILKSHLKN